MGVALQRLTNLYDCVPRLSRRFIGAVVVLAGAMSVHPAAAPSVGRIEGIVRLTTPHVQNVVVFIKNPPGNGTVPIVGATIAQKDEAFVPGVVAITTGSSVDFPNFDPYFHNVFSLSKAASFDLGRYPRGESRTRKFTTGGVVKVFCRIHTHMSASILVFDHTLFVIPDSGGRFLLDGVPVGTYQLAAWHERIGETVRKVKVDAGEPARVEFSLPVVHR
jgi:plastocyanin